MTGKRVFSQNFGVTGLYCACCDQPVGVVNFQEAFRMIEAEEPYVCRSCMALPEAEIATRLESPLTDYQWLQRMVGGMIIAGWDADEALSYFNEQRDAR